MCVRRCVCVCVWTLPHGILLFLVLLLPAAAAVDENHAHDHSSYNTSYDPSCGPHVHGGYRVESRGVC